MAIPELSQEDINHALQYIDAKGVPPGYGSKAYDLIVDGKKYPPKYVVAVARHLKDGSAIDTSDYNGVEAKNYFKARGYEIFVKKEILSETNYWLTGTFFDKSDKIDDFVRDYYWEGGQVNSSSIMNAIRSVKKGDVLLAKSASTKGPNHSIPFLKVKAIGIVLSDMRQIETPDWYKCDVEWIKLPEYKDFEGSVYGKYQGTMHLCKEKELIELAKKVLGMPMDDYSCYVNLLKANHNIILHGAPGTGKTYLAKKIAKAMGCGDDEIGFVQFHQSYDYTDFVEGLRPVQKSDSSQISFERQDGIFKVFCKKAQKNLEDSAKTKEQQSSEAFWTSKVEDFLDAVENGDVNQNDWKTSKTGNRFTISSENTDVVVNIPDNPKTTEINFPKETLIRLLANDANPKRVNDIRKIFDRKHNLQSDSYAFVLYYKIKEWVKEKNEGILKDNEIIQKKDFVFIIDEINRGEISKIFGELFFSIDPGYRGEKGKVNTQYQNLVQNKDDEIFAKGFYVPKNVYIIGTMNDIDRSVESMDFAMRRRFAFKEIKADDRIEMLTDAEKGLGENAEEAIKHMQSLNKAIEGTEGLSPAYDIGPTYFLKLKNYDGNFQQLWDYHIEGVLREYLRGIDDDGKKYEKLKNAYFVAEMKEETAGNTEE